MKKKRLSLKTVYYSSFLGFVVVPLVLVLILSLTVLNQVFGSQAVENIQRAQEAVAAELTSDIEQVSMRLSHMVYTNDSELLSLAVQTQEGDANSRYQSLQEFNEAASYGAEPVKNIVSMAFYMKDGRQTFFKADIQIPPGELQQEAWYREALEHKNRVVIGSYDTNERELYSGGTGDSLVLVAALAPDVSLDRSEKLEMTAFFQVTGATDKIKSNNTGYRNGKNKIGYTRLVDETGAVVYEPKGIPEEVLEGRGYTRVQSPVDPYLCSWYVESYVKTSQLTGDFWAVAGQLLAVTLVVLALYGVFSRYFLKRIINPVAQISQGMKQVEEGKLDIHLDPAGQYEIRNMIHSFNAMVRRLKALIQDYEERVRNPVKTREDYLAALIRGETGPDETDSRWKELFADRYVLFTVHTDQPGLKELSAEFDTIPRFASRCVQVMADASTLLVCCRIPEQDYEPGLKDMIREIQRLGRTGGRGASTGAELSVCLGRPLSGSQGFLEELQALWGFEDLYFLAGEGALVDLGQIYDQAEQIMGLSYSYGKLAAALYTADEKTVGEEREELGQLLQSGSLEEGRLRVLAVILATARQFKRSDGDFFDIFGQRIDYFQKLERIQEVRSLRLWMVNYLSWVTSYSSSRLDVVRTDAITMAKRYILEHYQDGGLSLKEVAEYVGLSEKYFTTKFTKECGETFLSYLTGLRVQKAKELIKTTTFKMYEIGEMVGYNNPEHFNRIFKKAVGMSPAQYRKAP